MENNLKVVLIRINCYSCGRRKKLKDCKKGICEDCWIIINVANNWKEPEKIMVRIWKAGEIAKYNWRNLELSGSEARDEASRPRNRRNLNLRFAV